MKPIKQILLSLSVLLAFTLSAIAQEYIPIIRTLPGQPTELKRVYRDFSVYPKTTAGDKAFLDAVRFGQLPILDRTTTPTTPETISWLTAVRYSYAASSRELYVEAASEDVTLRFESATGATLTGGNADGAVLTSGTYYPPGPNDGKGVYTKQWKFAQKDGAGGIPAGQGVNLTFQRVSSGSTASFTVIPAAGATNVLVYGSADSSPPVATTATYPVFARGLAVVNSFGSHSASTVLNWDKNNGMAASAPEKDYIHLIESALKTGNSGFTLLPKGQGSSLEQGYNATDVNAVDNTITNLLYEIQNQDGNPTLQPYDYLGILVGENSAADGFDGAKYGAMLDKLISRLPLTANCVIHLRTSVWDGNGPYNDYVRQYVAAKQGAGGSRRWIVTDMASIREREDYRANQKNSDGSFVYPNSGVRRHYNDAGHAAMAQLALASLRTESTTPTVPVTPPGTVPPGYGNVYAANSTYQARSNQTLIGSGERNGAYNRVYLANGGYKIGVNLTLGGTLDYISLSSQFGGKNQVNSPIYGHNGKADGGRQDPWSWYTFPNGQTTEEGPFHSVSGKSTRAPGLGWNSVEAGSEGADPHYGVLRAINVTGNSIYIENSGSQWEIPETAEQRNQKWISFDPSSPNAVREHVRLTMQRTDAQASHYPTRRQQEGKAIMRVADYYRVHYCNGQPYQRQWTSTTPPNNGGPLPFWSNEPGIIIENPETGACQAYYAPLTGRFGYWNATEGSNSSQDYQFQFFYWGSFPILSLDPSGVYDIDVALKNGSLEECRQWLYNQPRWSGTFNYVFNQKSRLAWTLHHGKDQLEAGITNGWQVTPLTTDNFHDGKDFKLISPEQWVNGRVVKKIYVKGTFSGGSANMTLFYYRVRPGDFAQLDTYMKNFSVINDGAERVYEIDMSTESNWNNQDIISFEIQHAYPYPPTAGAAWTIKQISSSPITN